MNDKNLMQEALHQTYLCGRDLKQVCTDIQERIQQGDESEALANMKQFLDVVGWISQALHMTQAVHQDYQLSINLHDLQRVLNPLVEALENRDFGSIDEILNYDFLPLLDGWSAQLAQIEPVTTSSDSGTGDRSS